MEKSKINADLKILLVGDCETGESNFVKKYANGNFNDSYKATKGAELDFKIFEFDGLIYRIQLRDKQVKIKIICMQNFLLKIHMDV